MARLGDLTPRQRRTMVEALTTTTVMAEVVGTINARVSGYRCGFRFDPATHSDLIPATYSNSIPAIHSDMDPATYSDRIPATP